MNFDEINILGNIINDTFGYGSTNYGEPDKRYPHHSLVGQGNPSSTATKSALSGDKLIVTSLSIKNLGQHNMQHQAIAECENELNQHIKKYIADVKKEFKKKENAGRALKVKQVKGSERTDVEMLNHYAVTRPAYVRRSITFEVS